MIAARDKELTQTTPDEGGAFHAENEKETNENAKKVIS